MSRAASIAVGLLCAAGAIGFLVVRPVIRRPGPALVDDAKPTVRLYLLSDLAGALEPCGCSKNQLGGLDHLAAFIRAEKDNAPRSLVFAAGPLLFMDFLDPASEQHGEAQDRAKADAIAGAMKAIGLSTVAPGLNDLVRGGGQTSGGALVTLVESTGFGTCLAAHANDNQIHLCDPSRLVAVAGVKVGVIGALARPPVAMRAKAGAPAPMPDLPDSAEVAALVAREAAALRGRGARLLIAVVAMDRGAALHVVDAVPELNVLLVGSPVAHGHANTAQPAPELVGSTLVVQTANHGQTVAVVDIFLRGDDPAPRLADAGGIAEAAKIGELSRRIQDLEHRIDGWETGGKVDPKDLADRKAELARLRAERDALQAAAAAQKPPAGSYFRYAAHEVGAEMGKDPAVAAQMLAFYKQVNERNRTALANLLPPPAGPGEASYVGVEACTACHEEARKVWDGTTHAHAYKTLADGFKEYNLECVGCHVTGYGKPGGSTVTHDDKLRDVQCEECHGPGSKHAKSPDEKGLIAAKPDPKGCVDSCHHPPHVEGFDASAKIDLVLGPGHGQ